MAKFEGGQGQGAGGAETDVPVSAVLLKEEEDEKDPQEEITELKGSVAKLKKELQIANEMVASVERRGQIEHEVSRAKAVDVETACLLTEIAISEMDEPDVAAAVRELRSRKPFLFGSGSGGTVAGSAMSAMVEGGQHQHHAELDTIAGRARSSGDRSELLRYLRARRGC